MALAGLRRTVPIDPGRSCLYGPGQGQPPVALGNGFFSHHRARNNTCLTSTRHHHSGRPTLGGRFATALSDTNTFGSYAGLMLVLFTSLTASFRPPPKCPPKAADQLITLLVLFVITIGLWTLVSSQSRGAFIALLAACAMAAWLAFLKVKRRYSATYSFKPGSLNPHSDRGIWDRLRYVNRW